MARIKLLITDFDGTLVDTFEANFLAYQKAFSGCGVSLSETQYQDCFGLRFDDFMRRMGIEEEETKKTIRTLKGDFYPMFFDKLKVNHALLEVLKAFKVSGGLTAVASTARKENLLKALGHIGATDVFSLILAGEDVRDGKPSPDIYNEVLGRLGVSPSEALVFEDSVVGMESAEAARISYIKVSKDYFHGNTSERP